MKRVTSCAFLLLALAACGGGGSGSSSQITGNATAASFRGIPAPSGAIAYIDSGMTKPAGAPATVRFFLTDAPNPQIDSAIVTISEVTVHKTGGAFFSVLQEERTLDLLDFQNGLTTLLGEVSLESGKYTQIRFSVVSGSVESGGQTYDVVIPSDIIKLNRNIDVCSGGSIDIVMDFDAQKSLKYNKGQNNYKMSPVVKITSITSVCPGPGDVGDGTTAEYTGPTGFLSIVIPALPASEITYSLNTSIDDIWVHDQGLGQLSVFNEAYPVDLLEPERQKTDAASGAPLYTVLVPPVRVPAGVLDQVRLLFQPIVATDSQGRTIHIQLPAGDNADNDGLKFFGAIEVCENALTILQWDLDLSPAGITFEGSDRILTIHPEIHNVNLRTVCQPYTE